MAVEDALGIEVPERDRLVRALLLECERLYNHVNDLGAIVNDAGFGIVNQHAGRLRETLLRHNARLTGHRLLRGAIRIGGADLLARPTSPWWPPSRRRSPSWRRSPPTTRWSPTG